MSESKTKNEVGFKTSIGGQALIEGILMRGPKKQAIVCRNQQDNSLITKVEEPKFIREKHKWLGLPLIRGTVVFLESMVYGVKALSWSASQLPEDEQEQPSKLDMWFEKHLGSEKAEKFIIGFAVFLGICISVGLFILLPTVLAGLIRQQADFVRNLLEGGLRIVIFLIYLFLCTRSKDLHRVFEYHGAEHKTIFCYEHEKQLTVENVRKESRFHPRCGTSFLFVVMIISILVFAFVQWSNVWVRMGMRILLLPVVVGIAYEINRWAGAHDENRLSKILTAPGKALQRLTTAEPDDFMLECAIEALKLVVPEDEQDAAWGKF